ncbi:MAG: hotdog fold thioesterase [Pseudomonadota bacterium]
MIWFNNVKPNIGSLDSMGANTLVSHVDIRFEDIGDDWVSASMPVDERTRQPFGILHGGATVVLAETLGSTAAACCVDLKRQRVVGLEINANHIRSVASGRVLATATAVHIGRSTHVWSIEQVDEQQRRVAISRLTMAVIENQPR